MSKIRYLWVLLILISFLVAGTPALAAPKGQGQGKGQAVKQNRGQSGQQGKKNNGQPPGWSQGKKTGWQGSSTPPGLQKKGQLPQGLQKSR